MNKNSASDLIAELQSFMENGQSEHAMATYIRLRAVANKDPEFWETLGTISLKLGIVSDAVQYLGCIAHGDHADTRLLFKYILALGKAGQYEEAISTAERLLNQHPGHAAAHANLAKCLRMTNRLDAAIRHCERALELQPNYPAAAIQLGISLQTKGNFGLAIDVLREALDKQPGHAMLNFRLGNLLVIREAYEEAIKTYRKAIDTHPGFAVAWYRMAGVQLHLGHLAEALTSYRAALTIRPEFEDAVAGEAGILMLQGEREAALRRIRPFIDRRSENIYIAVQFTELSRHNGDTGEALVLIRKLLQKTDLPANQAARLYYSAGDLYAHRENPDIAFAHYLKANALQHKPPAARREIQRIRTLRSVFTRGRLEALPCASMASDRPVFIVGMPRSGTSLLEQILASHPAVFGAGELMHLNRIAATLPRTLESGKPIHCIDRLTQPLVDELAAGYLQQLETLNASARRITDKMPHNFLHLGLIDRLFPGARVIHCRRDPMDTCLSCFTHDLGGRHAYIHDLATLGEYYRSYRELMQHWQHVLHIPLLNVDYETLVNDQEAVTRELLDFCGLTWDERCLRFHESHRITATASHDQVRQPLYRMAVGKWRHYAQHLQPLANALEGSDDTRGTG